jgi:hemolysin activation/secretion protein
MFKVSVTTAALLCFGQAALAQQTPTAGTQLQQIPPRPTPQKAEPGITIERSTSPSEPIEGGATVRVASLRITGNTVFSESQLIAAANLVPGSDLTLFDLRKAASRISEVYNSRGYFLAQAYLPAQDIKDGVVTVAVAEGNYGKLEVRNVAKLDDRVTADILSGLDTGDPVANAPLERRLLLLSDIPGVAVKSTLAPGALLGTSDLIVDIAPGRRVTGSVEADNAGNRYTGNYRAGGSINFNNLTGLGDLLSLRLLLSEGGLAYGRGSYQALVGDGAVGVAYTHLRYELGREFESLEADGSADIFSVFGSYPLVRSRDANLYALAGVDVKLLEDRIGLVSAESDKQVEIATLGFSGDSRDDFGRGGWTSFSGGLSVGSLDIQNPAERAADALTARSHGGFSKLQGSVARLQTLSGPLSLYASLRGQLAFDNLDSSEKLQLGGAYGVRAYPEGEAYGDQGYIGTVEARLMLAPWAAALPGELQLIGFIDAGEVEFSETPWFAGSNHASRSGFGAGLTWFGPHDLVLRGSYARKLGSAETTSGPDKPGRAWFQISKLF